MHGDNFMKENVIAIIPARGGSKGLRRKNIRLLNNKPLLAYSIEPALAARLVDRVIVCTEDEEIARIARDCGAETPFMRDPELAADDIGCNAVMVWTVRKLFDIGYLTDPMDITVYLQPTDLFKQAAWIDECIRTLRADPRASSAFLGCIEQKNYWEAAPRGGFRPMGGRAHPGHDNRQVKPQLYREDTGMGAAIRAYVWTELKDRLGPRPILLPKAYEFFDIHAADDLFLAEQYLKFQAQQE